MTITFTGAGIASAASGASPQAVTTTTSFAVGDIIVALMAYDNSGGGGADPLSTGTINLTPVSGSLGTRLTTQSGINDPGTASSGLAVRSVAFPVASAIPTSTVINVSWTGTVVVRAVTFMKVSSSSGDVINYRTHSGDFASITGMVNVANAAALTTVSVTNGEGVLGWAAEENGIALGGDTDTTNGSWGTIYGTFTGSGLTGMAAYMQGKVVTATATQTFNPTGNATTSDWLTGYIIFTETPFPAITQAAYRIYDDGTETGAVALAAQDTAANGDITFGDGIGQLRVRLQSTNAGLIPATDDWQLQWEKNASGTWADVTAASTTVKGYASPNITEGQATTNRLGAGTGSFVAGKAAEDGLVDNLGITANNYTELLYTVQIIKANVTIGDVIRFRVLRNGSTTGMTYTQVPTVNVVSAALTQAAYRFYDDGTESGSTVLAAQDTAYSPELANGNVNMQVRFRLQETGGLAIPATTDFLLQYEKNDGGSWNTVTTSASNVIIHVASGLADEQATTNRLGSGTGSFVAGKVGKAINGAANNLGLSANNYTEIVYPITLKQADLANGDKLEFRIVNSGAAISFTYTQTPTLNVVVTPVAITQAAYGFYDDGTETGSMAYTTSSVLLDTYSETNADNQSALGVTSGTVFIGQSFLATGTPRLTSAGFYLKKFGAPVGNVRAELYAHTGTFGSSGVGTGDALATSTNTQDASLLSTTASWIDFNFDGTYPLIAGTAYVIGVTATDLGATTANCVHVRNDATSSTHVGCGTTRSTAGLWTGTAFDFSFRVYGNQYSADISSGDVNAQVRMRLQSTSAANIPATDDFQLQWEKNTSGSWQNVVPELFDFYPSSEYAGFSGSLQADGRADGQSFIGNGQPLSRAGFYVRKNAAPTGTLSAVLYAHTGTFGSSSAGTGGILAVSTAKSVDIFTAGVFVWTYFDFDGSFVPTLGTPYIVAVAFTGTADATNYMSVAYDSSSATHPGNRTQLTSGSWSSSATSDLIFEIYSVVTTVIPYSSPNLTDAAATTNRLGAGSGSFVPGKLSEAGLVDNLGWSGNNYTELLYSITLKQADLADADTLRFRVLRNGVTTSLTYTQYPSLTILEDAPTTNDHLYLGDLLVSAMKLGDTNVAKAYLGDIQIFPAS